MKRTTAWGGFLASALLALIWTSATFAQDTPLTAREKALLDTVGKLQERLSELEKKVEALEGKAPRPSEDLRQRVTQIEESVEDLNKPNTFTASWNNGLNFATDDGKFKLQLGGRIQNDWAWMTSSDDLDFIFGDLEDATEFRRARLFVSGQIYEDVIFKAQYDFAGGDADFKDVYLGLKNIPYVGTVKAGHFKEPFGLEELTSSKYLTFMERSLTNPFTPGRNTGIGASNTAFDKRMTWAAGIFRDANDFGNGSGDGNYNVTARLTGLPWYEDEGRKLLHLGLAFSHRNPDGTLRYRERPEVHLSPVRFVDTMSFRADDIDLIGVEAAGVYGPFSVQGEYMYSRVDTALLGDLSFDGYYLQASYFITGEHKPYKISSGIFDRLKPRNDFSLKHGGWGAWEVAARYSTIDLDDGLLIRGGEEENITAALNWYLNSNTRVMWNYIRGDIDHDLYEGDVDALTMRLQLDF